jgi:tripartite-type tricarboxylate transporter receptor subunit TctC
MRGALGQPLIVDNVAGANGTLGTGKVARAKPDGYTLAFGSSFSTHVLNGAIYSLPFDVKNDFEPIALVADNPQIILARKAAPANDLKELIGWLKAHPDKVTLGQTGPGSPAGVSGVLFQNQIGSRFQFVNYRNVGQALQDLVAGHIDVMFFATIALEHVRAGRIKAFAVTARNRLQIAPDIPTVHEAGVPGFYYAPWFAMWAPKDTPAGAIAKVNASVTGALADPAVRQRFADLGYDIVPREQQTPEALGAFHSAEIEKWWPILKAAGIRGE